jgi:regulator of sigma E protease
VAFTILVTLGVLAVLILVHEWGHYIAARMFDIRVPRFSIGLGPKVFGFRRGETEFRVSALPLGGYVKVAGLKEMSAIEGGDDDEADADPGRTFEAKSPLAQAVVLSAGVAMNALLAVLLFATVALVWGTTPPAEPVVGDVVEERLADGTEALASLEPGTRITAVGDRPVDDMDQVARAIMAAHAGPLTLRFADRPPVTIEIPDDARARQFLPIALDPVGTAEPRVGRVVEGRPAHQAGLREGDLVLSVDGAAVDTWQAFSRAVETNPGRTLDVVVRRTDGARARLTLTPDAQSYDGRTLGRMGAGMSAAAARDELRVRKGPVEALGYGVTQSWDMVALMGQFARGLVDGRHSPRELGGPILIGQLSGAAARAGLPTLLTFMALLSINLAVINLLPIPVLDGGHLLFLGLETVRGRPVPQGARLALGRVGLTVVAALMIWALAVDVLRIAGL